MKLCCRAVILTFLLAIFAKCISSATYYPNSPISSIIVPYKKGPTNLKASARNVGGVDIIGTGFNLDRQGTFMVNGPKGMSVNFADGAYPVYYMPGSVNGKFNGKISLLI